MPSFLSASLFGGSTANEIRLGGLRTLRLERSPAERDASTGGENSNFEQKESQMSEEHLLYKVEQNVGYFTINPFIKDGSFDLPYLSSKKAVYEDEFIRHIRFKKPVVIAIDGKKKKGLVFKP